jgi:hypothetical protein
MNEHTAHPVVNLWKNKKQLLIKVEQCGVGNVTSKKIIAYKIYGKETYLSVTVTVMSTISLM